MKEHKVVVVTIDANMPILRNGKYLTEKGVDYKDVNVAAES